MGCIFAELLAKVEGSKEERKSLFQGDSSYPISPNRQVDEVTKGFRVSKQDQMAKIVEVLGVPDKEQLSFVSDVQAEDFVRLFKGDPKRSIEKLFPTVGAEARDLLKKLLEFNPYFRPSAYEALQHGFFNGISDKQMVAIPEQEPFKF